MNITALRNSILDGLLPILGIILCFFMISMILYFSTNNKSKKQELYLKIGMVSAIIITLIIFIISILVLSKLKQVLPLLKSKAIIILWILFPLLPSYITLNIFNQYHQLKTRNRGAK